MCFQIFVTKQAPSKNEDIYNQKTCPEISEQIIA